MAEEEGESSEVCPEITTLYTGLAIREYLLAVGEGSPYDFYKCFKRVKPDVKYLNVVRYFWLLKEAGLIRLVREEPPSRGYFMKRYYAVVPERVDDPAWFHPQQVKYPDTKWGKKRYWKVKLGGLRRG